MPMGSIPPVPSTLNYIFCDNPSTFTHAVSHLRQYPYLILDCEGYDLGRAGGSVTLICVGTPLAEHIFLFDVISPLVTHYDIHALLNLFRDSSILKVVWDGRMDYLEILHTYGAALEKVLDLQVAEVVSRTSVRGEGEPQRIRRLQNCFMHASVIKKSGLRVDGLHAVIGLQRCWKECGFPAGDGKDPLVVNMHKRLGSSMWVQRPLTEQLLQYAAKDILLIGILYADFYQRGWIPRTPAEFTSLTIRSQRYVSAHRDQGKSAPTDIFKPCQVMPLNVLDDPMGTLYACSSCHRWLSLAAYETRPDFVPSPQGAHYQAPQWSLLRRPRCRLCQLLALKAGISMDSNYVSTYHGATGHIPSVL